MSSLSTVVHAINRGRKFAVAISGYGLALIATAVQCHAQAGTIYYWIGGSDTWSSPTAWTTNGASGPVAFPPSGSDCLFTNAATYTINADAGDNAVAYGSNLFANAAFTSATITFNCGPSFQHTINTAFTVGNPANSTTTVYVASNTQPGLFITGGSVIVGGNGVGSLIVTSGVFDAASLTMSLGAGSGGQGHLLLSGPTTLYECGNISVGDASNSLGFSSMVISNSANLLASGSFRLGCGSGSASTNNTVVIASGGLMQLNSGPEVIGSRCADPNAVCINNGAIVMSNGTWRAAATTAHQIVIGNDFLLGQSGTAMGLMVTGNYLTVMAGGAVTNCREISITYSNSLNLLGGFIDTGASVVSNSGVVNAYGTMAGGFVVGNGGTLNPLNNATLNVLNSLGTFVVSNGFILATNGTMNVQLGTTYNPMVVALQSHTNSLITSGTINFSDSGGFTTGTWTIISFNTNNVGITSTTDVVIANNPILGTVPNPSYVYAFNTNNPVELELVVTCTNCAPAGQESFTQWQNQYFTMAELGSPSFSGPNADPFGKGMSNTNQYLAGFNPTNASAYVHITAIAKTNSGVDVAVTYLGASGDSSRSPALLSRTNVLEFTSGTVNGSYATNNFASTGQTNILSGGNGLGTLSTMVDPGGSTNRPSRYYRVRVLVP